MKLTGVALFLLLLLLLVLALAAGPDTAAGPAPQAGEAQEEEPLDTFVPSEKLPADSAVAFPVDI